ncbi:hypothetical protein OAN61_00515 [bacterium]|nr:hypothetical protein [bacterium]
MREQGYDLFLINYHGAGLKTSERARTLACDVWSQVMEGRVDGGFESLTYAEAKERSEKLDAQREKAALMLITVCVRANMAKVTFSYAIGDGSPPSARHKHTWL